jgi:hypothetical protein
VILAALVIVAAVLGKSAPSSSAVSPPAPPPPAPPPTAPPPSTFGGYAEACRVGGAVGAFGGVKGAALGCGGALAYHAIDTRWDSIRGWWEGL